MRSQFARAHVTHRTIYLGETFRSYVSVHNDSEELAADVVVKVCEQSLTNLTTQTELQTTTQRLTLTGTDQGLPRPMNSGESLDDTVQYEMKELGIHMFVSTSLTLLTTPALCAQSTTLLSMATASSFASSSSSRC